MSKLVLFCDEDIPDALIAWLCRLEPAMLIEGVGEPGLPPKGTKDPDLLLFAELMGYTMVSRDKSTLPKHVADHLAAGHHTSGVIILRAHFALKRYADELLLIWSASEAAEWLDRLEYIPW